MNAEGRSVRSLAQSFGIRENLIYRWRSEAATGNKETDDPGQEELELLRKRVRSLEEEREILKKALAIFSRQR